MLNVVCHVRDLSSSERWHTGKKANVITSKSGVREWEQQHHHHRDFEELRSWIIDSKISTLYFCVLCVPSKYDLLCVVAMFFNYIDNECGLSRVFSVLERTLSSSLSHIEGNKLIRPTRRVDNEKSQLSTSLRIYRTSFTSIWMIDSLSELSE